MEAFLGSLTNHAMNYAIRSGIAITSTYAIRQCSRLLKTVDDSDDSHELQDLQRRLDSKIRIISPAIDMIELIAARGHSSLESAVVLTKALRWDIQSLGNRLADAATKVEAYRRDEPNLKKHIEHDKEMRHIVEDMRSLLNRIEDAVPLINLAITTSGASLSTTLPPSVSPSRLLQASACLDKGDFNFSMDPDTPTQIGPTFLLSVYMLYGGRTSVNGEAPENRSATWKEVIHKASVKMIRLPRAQVDQLFPVDIVVPVRTSIEASQSGDITADNKANEFFYQLQIVEDFDDDRAHLFDDDEPQPQAFDEVDRSGVKEFVPIHQISKIFYADTGKILNIGNDSEANSPVLLLSRDLNARPPRRMMENLERSQMWEEPADESQEGETDEDQSQLEIDNQILREELGSRIESSAIPEETWRLPLDLDPGWIALELYAEEELESEDDSENDNDSAHNFKQPSPSRGHAERNDLNSKLAQLDIESSPASSTNEKPGERQIHAKTERKVPNSSNMGVVRSLSLLEVLIRLTSLQQFQQQHHLTIHDELLNFFLNESSTTGAGADNDSRRRTRLEARQRLGFDPYDESPVKRHGEEYQYRAGHEVYSRDGTPFDGYVRSESRREGERWSRERSFTPESVGNLQGRSNSFQYRPPTMEADTPPDSRPLAHRQASNNLNTPPSPYIPVKRDTRFSGKAKDSHSGRNFRSPLGRDVGIRPDSSLGTSPATAGENQSPVMNENDGRAQQDI